MLDEKKKMMAEKANKSSSIFGTIKKSFSNASASIKNIGRSLAISKPISRIRNLFNKEQNKDLIPKKVNTLKIVDQKQNDSERNRTSPLDVGKIQQTASGKDSLTPLREVGKNSEQFLILKNLHY